MPNIGLPEIILILILALIVFGPKKLPEVGRSVGRGLREFRRASQDWRDELERGLDPDEAPSVTPNTAGRETAQTDGNGATSPQPEERAQPGGASAGQAP